MTNHPNRSKQAQKRTPEDAAYVVEHLRSLDAREPFHSTFFTSAADLVERQGVLIGELAGSLGRLEDILGRLLEAGRIYWSQDDAPLIHGELEEARAALAKTEGR